MADREVKRCDRIFSMNDPDKGCLLGGVDSCRIGSEQVMRREEETKETHHAYGIWVPSERKSIVDYLSEADEDGASRLVGYLCMSFVDKVNELHGGEPVELNTRDMCEAYMRGARAWLEEREELAKEAENSRDLSGYADKLREIKAENAKKSAEKAKKSVEKALEKVGL